MAGPNMITINVKDLEGKDVCGLLAQVVAPVYLNSTKPRLRTLKRIYRKVEKGVSWLYLSWEPKNTESYHYDCGYSGWAGRWIDRAQIQLPEEVAQQLGIEEAEVYTF